MDSTKKRRRVFTDAPRGRTSRAAVVLVGALGNGLEIGEPNGNGFEEHFYYVCWNGGKKESYVDKGQSILL